MSRSVFARDQLGEARLVDRDLAAPQRLDPLGEDVTDDDGVAEVGEAGAGDETDVPGTEDGDPLKEERSRPSEGTGAIRRALGDPDLRDRPQPLRDREHRLVRAAGRAAC